MPVFMCFNCGTPLWGDAYYGDREQEKPSPLRLYVICESCNTGSSEAQRASWMAKMAGGNEATFGEPIHNGQPLSKFVENIIDELKRRHHKELQDIQKKAQMEIRDLYDRLGELNRPDPEIMGRRGEPSRPRELSPDKLPDLEELKTRGEKKKWELGSFNKIIKRKR